MQTKIKCTPSAEELLDRISSGKGLEELSIVFVAAHPDDETVGAGGHLAALSRALFIYITDGAPKNMHDAHAAGFSHRVEYAHARRAELFEALSIAGIKPEQCFFFDYPDQEASFSLYEITLRLERMLQAIRPDAVLALPYEGGHPDHDATAFALHAALQLISSHGERRPALIEMTSYHAEGNAMATADFLPAEGHEVKTSILSEEERTLKERELGAFTTQKKTLSVFPLDAERFRIAPRYFFTEPPHPGTLYYEHYDWGMNGARWGSLAKEALAQLNLGEPL